MFRLVTIAALSAAAAVCAFPQQFEVASIKPTPVGRRRGGAGRKSGHGRLTMNNVTLKRAVMDAWGIGPHQIAGGPEWLDADAFEIAARAETPVEDAATLDAMLRNLLTERFKLETHFETRVVPAFVLEVAKGGPKMEVSTDPAASTSSGRGSIEARKTTMDRFAEVLARQVDLPVVNHTALEGAFNLDLEWTPVRLNVTVQAPPEGPSVFTAIQEQLGLKLVTQKEPIGMLVIDHAERPGDN